MLLQWMNVGQACSTCRSGAMAEVALGVSSSGINSDVTKSALLHRPLNPRRRRVGRSLSVEGEACSALCTPKCCKDGSKGKSW